jgi:glycerol kinase
MMKSYVLVIDEGTTGTRALLFDRSFRIKGQSYDEITQYTPSEDKVEHDPIEIYEKSLEMCRKVLKQSGVTADQIACIGITNQRNTSLLWDKNTGKPLYNAIVWQDTRTANVSAKIKESPEYPKIFNSTGKVIAPHCSGLMLQWLIENVPGAKQKVQSGDALFGTIDTWLVWKLTGGKTHAVSYSNASSMGCLDLGSGTWNKHFLDYLGVPMSVFAEIRSESADYGVTDQLGAPIPITGVIADQQSSLFAQGCHTQGTVKCTNGTGSFMDINIGTNCVVASGGLDTLIAWNLKGVVTYAVEGFAAVTGSAVQWLRDGLEIIRDSSETESIAAQVTDTNGVYFVPALAGLITPHQDPYARGVIVGITRGAKKAHIVRATLESIAFTIKDIMTVVEKETGVKINDIKIDGGASRNNLLAQMMADHINARIDRTVTTEATSLGAAQMAGMQAGIWKMEDFTSVVEIEKSFAPVMSEADRTAAYTGWTEAVNRSKKWIMQQ